MAQAVAAAFGSGRARGAQVQGFRRAGEEERVVFQRLQVDVVVDAPARRASPAAPARRARSPRRIISRSDGLDWSSACRRNRSACRRATSRADGCALQMRMCITGRELVLISPISPRVTWLEKPGKEDAMRDQPREGGFGGARQNEEEPAGHRQDAERDQRGKQAEARVETLQAAARGDGGAVAWSGGFRRW